MKPRLTLRADRQAEPCTLVIYGVTGDLARRKLLPALFNLALDDRLPKCFRIVGVGRTSMDTDTLRADLEKAVRKHSRRPFQAECWKNLHDNIHYVCSKSDSLAEKLQSIEAEDDAPCNRLFYLATPPSAFMPIVQEIAEEDLQKPGRDGDWTRLVVEKPIGVNLDSANNLNDAINRVFDEREVYRIDHYLGKETVQNMLVFRFANAIFEPLWNHKYIDHVQITVAESLGVEGRAPYFEEAGTMRDMIQNHVFQLLCLIGMEPPGTLNANAIRDEKVKVLQALRPIDPDAIDRTAIRGQYTAGAIDGAAVPGYREEPGVAEKSCTETFAALRVYVDNWRWADVPFYLRTGKRLGRRVSEVSLQFKDVPHRLFRSRDSKPSPNVLTLRIQPDESITLHFDAKVPSSEPEIRGVRMEFDYDTAFQVEAPGAYERLLLDAMIGDSTLFIRRDEVEASWAFLDPLLEAWQKCAGTPPPEYVSGSWGPSEADVLLAADGRVWRRP